MTDKELLFNLLGLPPGSSNETAAAVLLALSDPSDAERAKTPAALIAEKTEACHVHWMCGADENEIRGFLGLPPFQFDPAYALVPLSAGNPYRCSRCGKFTGFDGHCGKCGFTLPPNEMEQRARRLINKALLGGLTIHPIRGLAWREPFGRIDLDVGFGGFGTERTNGTGGSKLRTKHPEFLDYLPKTLVSGDVYPLFQGNVPGGTYLPNQRCIILEGRTVFLSRKERKVWRIDSFYFGKRKAEKVIAAAEFEKRLHVG